MSKTSTYFSLQIPTAPGPPMFTYSDRTELPKSYEIETSQIFQVRNWYLYNWQPWIL